MPFALKEWPAVLPDSRKAKRFLEEVIDALNSERPTDKTRIHHEIAARAACRAAIMAGDSIAPQEVTQLLIDLAACERPMTCPHGRPTHIRLSREELDRRFKRI
jgi:DNA mismatch repair protein MutL